MMSHKTPMMIARTESVTHCRHHATNHIESLDSDTYTCKKSGSESEKAESGEGGKLLFVLR